MSIERIIPGSVEGYEDFETIAKTDMAFIEELFDEIVECGLPLIDEDFELSNVSLLKFTDLMARVIYQGQPVEVDDAIATAHRAFFFGLLVSRQLFPMEEWGFNLEELQDLDSVEQMQEYFSSISTEYLKYRPAIDSLIARYMPSISPQPGLEAGAETIASFALRQVEKEHYKLYIDGEATGSAEMLGDTIPWQ